MTIVGIIGVIAILYARGFRLRTDEQKLTIGPTGLLVANSDPTGAQVFVDDELKTATDNSISLTPGAYVVSIKKDGFLAWNKTITIEKETVTQVDAFLVSAAPSLTALTFSGAVNPVASEDFSKIAYVVPPSGDNIERAGLWIMETVNLPLGFNRDPRRITDGDLTNATFEFSPDAREILLNVSNTIFLLNVSEFTPQASRVNVALQVENIKREWQEIRETRLAAKIAPLPDKIEEVFANGVENILFSPDENRILYQAKTEATIPEGLITELPGSSTQQQERELSPGKKYIYDIREDRNFAIANSEEVVYWISNSLNLVIPEEGKISIIDYDGTNRKTVFSGSYVYPIAYPATNVNRLLLLTNFGASDSVTNLYWLSLK
jgi:dipeptidyl aminopeptidase/acylaminoacyl peptidase